MYRALAGMVTVFGIAFLVGLVGLVTLPNAWQPAFASLVGVSGFGLGLASYAISTHYGHSSSSATLQQSEQ